MASGEIVDRRTAGALEILSKVQLAERTHARTPIVQVFLQNKLTIYLWCYIYGQSILTK